jgi:signal transduction histidine kinase/HAMP domain-containing protein
MLKQLFYPWQAGGSRVRLYVKVTVLTIAILGVIGFMMTAVTLYVQIRTSTDQYEQMASALGFSVLATLESDFIEADWQHIHDEVARMRENPVVNEVVVFNPQSRIIASGKTEEVGNYHEDDKVTYVLTTGKPMVRTETRYGEGEICVLTPLLNKPECQICHSSDPAVLGAIEIGLSTASLDAEIQQQVMIMGAFGIITLLVVGGGLTFMLRRTVLDPLAGLAASARRIGQGDYSARVEHKGGDELSLLASTFNDMADRVETHARDLEKSRTETEKLNRDLENRVQQRTGELTILLKLSRTLASTLDLGRLQRSIMDEIGQALGPMEVGILFLYDEAEDALKAASCFGCELDYVSQVSLRPGEAIAGRIFETGMPMISSSPDEISFAMGNITEENARLLEQAKPCLTLPDNVIGAPLVYQDRAIGSLLLMNLDNPQERDLRLLQALADQIAVAVENARLYEEVQRKEQARSHLLERIITAQEEERMRVARELHDEAGQMLSAVMMSAAAAAEALPEELTSTKNKLMETRSLAGQALADVRKLILDLRPAVLDDLGLVPAIRWLVKNRLEIAGIKGRVEISGLRGRLSPAVETTVFRVVQEAVTNIARHSKAETANVHLEMHDLTLTVLVEDDGQGFDVLEVLEHQEKSGGWGLRGIEERVSLLGGELHIDSQSNQGTRLSFEIPLDIAGHVEESDVTSGEGVSQEIPLGPGTDSGGDGQERSLV